MWYGQGWRSARRRTAIHKSSSFFLFHQKDETVNLGGLDSLPGCRELLIRKHTAELERVMRLWRALVQQMKSQVPLVELNGPVTLGEEIILLCAC